MSLESEMDRMEEAHDRALDDGDIEEARAIEREMNELRREMADRDRWEEEGEYRGWR